MEIIPFGSQDVDNILAREPQRAESLAFGAVLLDRSGKVVKYNKAEGMIAGRDPSDVVGKDFFNEIAPCAKASGSTASS
jgi:photoactive yellow protein